MTDCVFAAGFAAFGFVAFFVLATIVPADPTTTAGSSASAPVTAGVAR